MILSLIERHDIENTYEKVCDVELSLVYQIKKIQDLCKKVESELDKPRETWYIGLTDFEHNVDFLINSFSVLIEYYHSWVIQQRIGLSKPDIKIDYKPIKKGDYDLVDKVLKKYGVGKTDRPELYDFDLYEKCKFRYLSDMSFFFIGKNHEIFVLNNYIKHNHMLKDYAPRVILENENFSFAYLYIHDYCANLLNNSLLRHLLNHTLDEIKDSFHDEYYKNYVIESNNESYRLLNLDIIVINGLEYIKSSDFVGLSIESLLESIKLASIDILDVMIDELDCMGITGGTNMDNFLTLKNDFKTRKNKTIYNISESKQ
ncbi:hypothetical protein [Aliarcobacter vitoriensis]|uniref:Uncharacterized protein n=1 Tax=Aliarcobacter vitoriensis TaxID=2011099 RepID=A0A366MTW5_9BACT|nr:hypothetical protein [Aliarcobacter vitoriensis]RBQ29303.1 hypothetical protein CRU91_04260 [Aliarcobacter vitoriensis]